MGAGVVLVLMGAGVVFVLLRQCVLVYRSSEFKRDLERLRENRRRRMEARRRR